ncbi:Dihydrofolate reductase [Thermomonospora echinospora]|uniref:Dihydrofolate reductase n=1 Tax=Thermomonospora echinospora TaxID=1992 RepID=A0A1H5ZWD5_9ACTN|nr:dihydrofolate reductase family protein [Thermomonospora echinospora]SEG40759.1 Dihydrofolate reductase [Thermomonospora echinospora]
MRKIINSTYVSLDGVIARPNEWTFEYFNEEAQKFAYDQLFSCDALLMGRKSYEGFAASWPHMEEETGDFGVRMNTMSKYVVSTTLKDPEWKNTAVISDNVVKEIAELKERPGQDILQYGYGPVTRLLIEHGLLDELRLWIHPVIVGTGDPEELLTREGFGASFEAAETKVFTNGVIIATYRPAAKEAAEGEGA